MRTADMPLKFLIVVAAAVVAAGAHQEASAQDEMDTVTVGILVPYGVGEYSTYVLNAIDLSVHDFNRGAHERGWMLETVKADTRSDGGTALRAVESMYADGIRVVIGPAYSSVLEHISGYVNRNGIVTVSYASGSTSLSIPGDYIFRTVSDADTIAGAFVAQMRSDGITRVVMISVDDAIGRSVGAAVGSAVGSAAGMDMAGSLQVPLKSAEPDYTAAVASLEGVLAGIPDADHARTAVVLFDHSGGIVDVARSAAALGGAVGDTRWYGPDHSMAELEMDPVAVGFMKIVDYRTVELAANENHVNVCIDAGLGARIPAANILAYHAYDAVSIVGAAIDAAGGPDYDAAAVRNGMVEASRGLDAPESAMGVSAAFNENGDLAASDYLVYEIDDASDMFIPTARYDSASDSVVPSPVYEPRRIGVLVSETGPLTELGYPAGKAICLAAADYNSQLRAGGADWQLRLTKIDDGAIPSRTLDSIRELYGDGIRAVLGPVSSSSLSAVMSSFEGIDDTVVISYASSSPTLSVEGDNVFRIRAPDTHTAPAYVKLLEHDGIESVVVVHREDAWGHALSDAVEEQLARKPGIDMIASFQYDPAETSAGDLKAVSDRVGKTVESVDGKKAAILLFGFNEISVLLGHASANPSLQDSKWYGYSRSVIGTDPGRADWEERVRFLSLNPAYAPNDVSRHIYDSVPGANVYALYAYDATFTLANAVGTVGSSTDAARLVQAVPAAALSIQNPAIGFPLALDAAGDLDVRHYTAVVYRDGSFVDYAYYDGSEDMLRLLYQPRICR